MSWIILTTADVQSRLADAELVALRNQQLAAGQPDPLPEVIERVVEEVRGYVAGCSSNVLGSAGAIPARLEDAALAIIRTRLASRLPDVGIMTEDRRTECQDALRLLRDVAACKFSIPRPANAADATEQGSGAGAQIIHHRPHRYSGGRLDGI